MPKPKPKPTVHRPKREPGGLPQSLILFLSASKHTPLGQMMTTRSSLTPANLLRVSFPIVEGKWNPDAPQARPSLSTSTNPSTSPNTSPSLPFVGRSVNRVSSLNPHLYPFRYLTCTPLLDEDDSFLLNAREPVKGEPSDCRKPNMTLILPRHVEAQTEAYCPPTKARTG